MRFLNKAVLSGANNANQTGSQLDSNQWVSASFHLVPADSAAQGTFKLQASNDVPLLGNAAPIENFVATNWIDIPTQTTSVAAGAQKILTVAQTTYRWMRAVWVSTAVKASLVVQDLTYTAVLFGTSGNSITIRNLGDGTAGAETVSVVSNAITIHMEDGVSTATQIRTAVLASAPALALISVAISGTGSNAQTATSATPLASGAGSTSLIAVNVMALSM